MMKPLVTLMTPVYNAMPYLNDYLDSVVRQSWRPLQVILVDDGSDDRSLQQIEEKLLTYNETGIRAELIPCSHNGQAHAVNQMLPLVEGEFLTWCDADDLLEDDSIEKKCRYLLKHSELSMVRSNGSIYDDGRKQTIGEYAKENDKKTKDIFAELLTDKTYCFAGAYMIRTKLLFESYPQKKIPESPEGQNLQLLLPCASRSLCGYIDEKLHVYRRHSGSHSLKSRSYQESLKRIKNFTFLKREILEYCDCYREEYEMIIKQTEEASIRELMKETARKARQKKEDIR